MRDRNPLRVTERPGEGLALVQSFIRLHTGDIPLQTLLWAQTGGLRKKSTCEMCGRGIVVGEKAYRPITNSYDRDARICPECIDRASAPNFKETNT